MRIGKRHWLLALLLAALGQALLVGVLYKPKTSLSPSGGSVVTLELGGLASGPRQTGPARPTAGDTETPPRSRLPTDTGAGRQPEPPTETSRPVEKQPPGDPAPAPPRLAAAPAATGLAAGAPKHRPTPAEIPKPTAAAAAGRTGRSGRAPTPDSARTANRPGESVAARHPGEVPRGAGLPGSAVAGDQPGSTQTGSSPGGAATVAGSYYRTVSNWLERHKRYPKRAIQRGQQGTVKLVFTIDRSGQLLSQRIAASSGHRLLDREAKAMLRRAAPLPALPREYPDKVLEISLPVRFALR